MIYTFWKLRDHVNLMNSQTYRTVRITGCKGGLKGMNTRIDIVEYKPAVAFYLDSNNYGSSEAYLEDFTKRYERVNEEDVQELIALELLNDV